MTIVLVMTYAVTMFVIDMLFGWFGGEDGISWVSIAAGCVACTAGVIIADIIRICRQILTTTTIMFSGLMLIDMKDFTEKDLKGGMKATGLSAASLLCVFLH